MTIQKIHLASRLFIRTVCGSPAILWVRKSEGRGLLLTDILRNRWGYEGMVVTDWGAVKDRTKGIAAGQDLEMPGGSGSGTKSILSAIKAGTLSEEALNTAVRNLLWFVDSVTGAKNTSAVFDRDADYRVAVSIAENSAVLLKNEKGVLPLVKGCKAVFLGEFAEHPRYQGGGSSHVNSAKVSCALEAAVRRIQQDVDFLMRYLPNVPDDAYVKTETTKILKQHKAYMAQFEELLNMEL